MRLFLSSLAISPSHVEPFSKLVGKNIEDITIGLIEDAADVYTGDTSWVDRNRQMIVDTGAYVEQIVLKNYVDKFDLLEMEVSKFDCVFLGGGNTFYLRELIHQTQFDTIVRSFMEVGLVYAGGSCGAVVAGPTLNHIELADDPSVVGVPLRRGMHLVDDVVIPHWESDYAGDTVREIYDRLSAEGVSCIPIRDDQAVIYVDGQSTVIP